jgi:hypothetical protein
MVPAPATTGSVTSSISSARQTRLRLVSAQVADWNQAGFGTPDITEAASAPTQDCGWITERSRESTRTHVPRSVRCPADSAHAPVLADERSNRTSSRRSTWAITSSGSCTAHHRDHDGRRRRAGRHRCTQTRPRRRPSSIWVITASSA